MPQDKDGGRRDAFDELRNAVAEIHDRLGNMDDRVGNMDDRVGNMDDRVGNMDDRLGNIDDRLGNVHERIILLAPALAGLAGLDNIAAGVAELVEVLAPIGRLGNPPQAPEDNVVDAIERVLAAIGPELATIDAVPVPEAPVGFIGQPL
jgi:hypothetical protein